MLTLIKDNLREERINRGERKREYSPNDKLEIWSTGAAIKSQSLKKSRPYLLLTNCIFTFCHLEERLSNSWLLPELFFFVSFFYLIKKILLLILLIQTRQFRVLFVVVEVLYLSKALYLRGKLAS